MNGTSAKSDPLIWTYVTRVIRVDVTGFLIKAESERLMSSPIVPCLRYDDPTTAIEWLCSAFGFQEHNVYRDEKGSVQHAELSFGDGLIMIGPNAPTEFGKLIKQPKEIGNCESQICFIFVPDAAAHFEHSKRQGAEIVMPLKLQEYGASDYVCRDPEGHIWSFGDYNPWKKPTA